MRSKLKIVVAFIVALPAMALAASDCHVVEYQDHYEAVCVGNESPVTVREKSVTTTTREVAAQAPVTPPSSVKDPLATATDSPPSPPTGAVKRFRDFSQQEAQRRALRDAAKASRISTIQQNQFTMPVQNDAGSKP